MSSLYTIPLDTPFCLLDCQLAFDNLTDDEKRYAHFLSQACWYGGLIVLHQTSPESPIIFLLLQKLFRGESLDSLRSKTVDHGCSEDDVKALLVYAGAFYSNMGNYKSFGDTKFIPDLSEKSLWTIIEKSSCYMSESDIVSNLWQSCSKQMYSLEKRERQLGIGNEGISTYFSYNCTNEDAIFAQKFLDEKNISAYNTRLFKTKTAEGEVVFEVRVASGDMGTVGDSVCGSYTYDGININITSGDYNHLLQHVVDNLIKAKEYSANENELKMLENYIESFAGGSIEKHKDGSRYWIRDKGPIVESYIGFIESYRDPYGTRGEFEGFVSMVNKVMSAKFAALVSSAETWLLELPWPSEYEKDVFLKPDFTSLDVLTFGGSGIPAGINIPNYDDIRQIEGFKNVSLGNVLSSHSNDQKITFLRDEDKEVYTKLKAPSFEVQVGLHELLGHGSGKLFKMDDGKLNFDVDSVKHLVTGTKISSWYNKQETWDSKFSTISSTYEECRAECVGLYLCLNKDILGIFGHEGVEADDISYVNWLNMCRAGVMGLEFYTPETNKWRQAHMQARFVILRVLCEAGEDLVTLQLTTGDDGQPDVIINLDSSKINTVGKKAIGDFLRKLQVYKSTADFTEGSSMYLKYSEVDGYFMKLRNIVMDRRLPRRIFVQCNTVLTDAGVALLSYEATAEGMVKSFSERCTAPDIDEIIKNQWLNDKHLFE